MPTADTWNLVETPIPTLEEGQILVKQHFISLDPAMRGWMDDRKSYLPPIQIGEVMRAGSVGEVVESKHPKFAIGDVVTGWGGVQQYAATDGKNWYKVDTTLAPMPTYISTLGMPGMTAYFGILEVGKDQGRGNRARLWRSRGRGQRGGANCQNQRLQSRRHCRRTREM